MTLRSAVVLGGVLKTESEAIESSLTGVVAGSRGERGWIGDAGGVLWITESVCGDDDGVE